jgi:hypothetical protein
VVPEASRGQKRIAADASNGDTKIMQTASGDPRHQWRSKIQHAQDAQAAGSNARKARESKTDPP